MIDLVLTVMISALSLAQNGQAAITTNELAPPPGLSNANTPPTSHKTATPAKNAQAAAPEKRSETPADNKQGAAAENASPAGADAAASTAPSGAGTAQPTAEEKQAPTSKQAGGSGGPGRVAAFWFILPNRPPANK